MASFSFFDAAVEPNPCHYALGRVVLVAATPPQEGLVERRYLSAALGRIGDLQIGVGGGNVHLLVAGGAHKVVIEAVEDLLPPRARAGFPVARQVAQGPRDRLRALQEQRQGRVQQRAAR